MKTLILWSLAMLIVAGSSSRVRADGKENAEASSAAEIAALEQRVAALEKELAELKAEKGILKDDADTPKRSVADEVRRRRAARDAAQSEPPKRELDPEERNKRIAAEIRRRRAAEKAAQRAAAEAESNQ